MAAKINKVHIHNLVEEIKWFTAVIERHKQFGDDSQLDQYVSKRNKLYSELVIELVKVLTTFKSEKLAIVLSQVVNMMTQEAAAYLEPMPKELENSLQELETVI